MNILVTGGAGFIGSHTVDAALAAGHSVRVLDDLSTGTAANLPDSAELLTGDVTDLAAVEQALQGCDAVIHLAALVSVPQSLQEPANTYHVNTTGTVGLLEAARQAGVRRAVLASTCAVYGDLPGRKSEDSLVQPLVPYAASKRMAEQWLQLYAV
ncbi:MAG: NAD-dependent epimerase/dehydratase family protein, partial [Caldilinea sp.]|nr:NAD-dependent epimerase/dehydratase family protein [Caldilinea sp.]